MSATNRFLNSFSEYEGELNNYREKAYELKELAQTAPEKLPAQIFQTLGEPIAAHIIANYGPKGLSAAKNWIGDQINSKINEAKGVLQDAQNKVQDAVQEARGQVQEAANGARQQAQRVIDVSRQNLQQNQAPRETDGAINGDQPFETGPRVTTTENPPAPDEAVPNNAAPAAEGETEQPGSFIGQLKNLLRPRNTTERAAQQEPEQQPELDNPFRTGTDYESWTPAQQEDYQDIINGRVTGAANLTDDQFAQASADRAALVRNGMARPLPGEEELAPQAQASSTIQNGDAIYSQGASRAFMRARAPQEPAETDPEINPELSAMQASQEQQGTAATAQQFGEAPTRSLADEFQDIPGISIDAPAQAAGAVSEGLASGANAAVEAGEAIGTGVAGGVDSAVAAVSGAAGAAAGGAVTAGETIAETSGGDPGALIVGGLVALGGILSDIFSHHKSVAPPPPNVPTAAFTAGLPSD